MPSPERHSIVLYARRFRDGTWGAVAELTDSRRGFLLARKGKRAGVGRLLRDAVCRIREGAPLHTVDPASALGILRSDDPPACEGLVRRRCFEVSPASSAPSCSTISSTSRPATGGGW